MVESFSLPDSSGHLSEENLLESNEIVVVVDDSEESVAILQNCLEKRDLPTMAAGSIDGLLTILGRHRVALVLLDLELPDRNSNTVLEELTGYYPDLGIIIVTATTDLETALNCLRDGADDYLTKPINDSHLYYTVVQVLRKRKLIIENRVCRRELQLTNLRTQFLHHLILKMNSGYLSEMELEVVLQTILIGITSEEGLAFNRAFLALFDEDGSTLKGELAIGPDNREDALVIWEQMKNEKLDLQALFYHAALDAGDSLLHYGRGGVTLPGLPVKSQGFG